MKTAIIVDDSKLAREKLKAILERCDISIVAEGSSGKEAIELHQIHKPDLIFLDIEMPQINGIVAAENILRHQSDAKIIIVSSNVNKKAAIVALNHGVRFIVAKPIDETTLTEKLATLFQSAYM
ncbi:MAG: response regulator [Campylobacterales bacterium]|nr:response regulator [Campylobacterales bacterium]